jgi:hypothetical protein
MTWMHSLIVLRDPEGRERLVSYYEVIRDLGHTERAGLAVFNDEKREFAPLVEFPEVPKFSIDGNASAVRGGGRDYFYFKGLWPSGAVRVPAEWKAIQDLGAYEIFEPEGENGVWKRGAVPGKPPAPTYFTDVQTGENISVHCDAIAWNEYRKPGSLRSSALRVRFGTPKPTPPQDPSYMPCVWRSTANTPSTGQCRIPSSTRTADGWSISKALTLTPFPATP